MASLDIAIRAGDDTDQSGGGARPARSELARALDTFLEERPSLMRIALRITRDAPRAEDCVQEAWLRWQLTDRDAIVNPSAFLATTVTHLAINAIQSAPHRHEITSEWLHDEPALHGADPSRPVEERAAVTEILAVLMARLSAAQLAAYLLRKCFDYPYAEIARLLRTTSPNARQLIRRAQARATSGRERPVAPASHRLLVDAFLAAARVGDLNGLERVLLIQGHARAVPARARLPRPSCRTTQFA
ncbi:sigma factor [Microbacterium kyungheense]|uniref:RNA polymerase sigma factor (Sigma-70 family) n=1 Tax=Microbacterium kyungheense TaxID=1263636 RepID=A0A543FIT8_9MICO|nr:sigma factor [Microbacterium kyungheense]TQM33780.1 RNA polymerase sigma factor (sigma-70 family) [Microbacterium kyungheense]